MQPIAKKIIIFCSLVGMVFVSLYHTVFFNETILERAAARCTYPLYLISNFVSRHLHSWSDHKNSYAELSAKYTRLHVDYMEIIDEVIALKAAQRHYINTKDLTEFKERYALDYALTAKILVKNITPNAHYFIINRGARDGVSKDMVAFYQRHIIGRVTDVYDYYSKVLLITDQYCKVSIYTGKTKAPGIHQGFNSINRCSVSYVSHLFDVQNNDLIISSGQGLVFPEGFCLGKIVLHSLKEKSLYHYLEVEPMINLASLTHCLVADAKSIKPF